jgi:uncharacterized protein
VSRFPLRRLRLRPGDEFRDTVEIVLEPFDLGGNRYLPIPDTVTAELAIQRAVTGDVFRLAFRGRLHGPCVRCLEDAVVDLEVEGREYQDAKPAGDENLMSEYVVEDQLELSTWARDALALALPDQILCRPDCAGLCAVCGIDLNREPHGHDSEEVDSRWSALQGLRPADDAPSS